MINILHEIMLLNKNIEHKIIKNCKENIDIYICTHTYACDNMINLY
jgi:hypothetical protein